VLRTEGLPAFLGTLSVAAHWLNQFWAQVYPLVDDDAILRKNALNSFADRMAIVDGVRRLPVVRHPVLGTFSLRDFEIATGQLAKPDGEEVPDEAAMRSILAASAAADLTTLQTSVLAGLDALKAIETRMREQGGSESAPTFDPLVTQLVQLQRLLSDGLAAHPNAPAEAPAGGNGASTTSTAATSSGSLQAINSRHDAIRALDAVSAYFRANEPSSPIPLFIERAKRLVAKDFLEVLADIAPDALSQARSAGGLRDD
jgi:type VI secretion system protein ImpA